MLTWLDVLTRITHGEDATTEFKREFKLDKVGPAVAAMANSEGGLVILGVDDNGDICGVKADHEKVSEKLTSLLQSGLSQPVQALVGKHQDVHGWVHWLEIPRQRGFEPMMFEQRPYVRRHRSSVQPSASELQDLYNTFGFLLTEERTFPSTSAADIDEAAFHSYMSTAGFDLSSEPTIPLERDLLSRGVLAPLSGALVATLYGILAFGRRPQGYAQTSSFVIECVAYAGSDRSGDPLTVSRCEGRLDEQVERAEGWLRSLGRTEIYGNLVRKDRPLLPAEVLREGLVNAVVHRDYAVLGSKVLVEVFDEELVITSPGTLPNHMTPESVLAGGHPRSRNELLATFMASKGLLEGRGRGFPRMKKAMREFNGTLPILEENRDGRYVRLRFDRRATNT